MQRIKDKLAHMTPRQQIEYLKEYYGLQILFLSLGMVLVILFAVKMIQKKEYVLNILPLNANSKDIPATGTDYFKDFLTENGIDSVRSLVGVSYSIYIDPESEDAINQEGLNMMQTLFMAEAVDVVLADEATFEAIANDEYLAELQGNLPDEVLTQFDDHMISVKNEETGQLMDVGIKVKNEGWLANTGWYHTPYVCIGLANNMSHPDLAIQFLLKILNNQDLYMTGEKK